MSLLAWHFQHRNPLAAKRRLWYKSLASSAAEPITICSHGKKCALTDLLCRSLIIQIWASAIVEGKQYAVRCDTQGWLSGSYYTHQVTWQSWNMRETCWSWWKMTDWVWRSTLGPQPWGEPMAWIQIGDLPPKSNWSRRPQPNTGNILQPLMLWRLKCWYIEILHAYEICVRPVPTFFM